jgi:hypothetical protein
MLRCISRSVVGEGTDMKPSVLLRWIEAAERARFCLLATENSVRATCTTTSASPSPFDLSRLRQQLCLGDAARRLSRLARLRSPD